MISRAHGLALVSLSLGLALVPVGCSSDSSADDTSNPATGAGGSGGASTGTGGAAGNGASGKGGSAGAVGVGGSSGSGGKSAGGTSGAGGTGAGGTQGGSGGTVAGGSGGTATAGSGGTTGGSGGSAEGGSGGTSGGSGGTGGAALATQKVKTTNLVSDQAGMGALTDANLVNAWGLAFNPTGPLWVANNHSGTATVYDVATPATLPLVVAIPSPTAGTPGAPTGQIFNATPTAFMGDAFILSTEDGTLIGWAKTSGTTSAIRADQSAGGAIYKGLASLTTGGKSVLLAPDFHNGKIDVFDDAYAPTTLAGAFTDPAVPAGYGPYNVMVDGDKVFVAFAMQDDMKMDDTPGPGLGFVSQFDATGALVKTLISGGDLNAPWGLAMAPADFGAVGGSLLVGNFGDGAIHAYDAATGAELSTLVDETGAPISIPGLWALTFGPGTAGAAKNQLFVSSGPNDENHGLLSRIDAM